VDAEYYFEEGCFITELSNAPDDPGTTERYVMLEGSGRVEIGDDAPRDVGPGDVVLIAPMVRQRITNVGKADLVFLAICTPRFRRENYENV
jgi:mannose-6-phosphate isomerase-like protein (cupin superfamily)